MLMGDCFSRASSGVLGIVAFPGELVIVVVVVVVVIEVMFGFGAGS
jgi:hypothetical protein